MAQRARVQGRGIRQAAPDGFTLFEVLIALAVFALAVMGLAMALQTAFDSALDARKRSLARIQLESRLAEAMANPPLNTKKVIEARDNHGIRIEESMLPYEVKSTNGTIVPGMWKLKIDAIGDGDGERNKETVEILVYHP